MAAAPEAAVVANSRHAGTHPSTPAQVDRLSPARRTSQSPTPNCKEWLACTRSTRTTTTSSMARMCQTIQRSRAFMRSKLSQLCRVLCSTLVKQQQLEASRLLRQLFQNRARLKSSSPITWRRTSATIADRSLQVPRRCQIWSTSPHSM